MIKSLSFLLLLSGCASGLTIRPGNCPAYVVVKNEQLPAAKSVTVIQRDFGVGEQVVTIPELLAKAQGPECGKLVDLRLSIVSDGLDQLMSALPFYSQWSVVLEWDEAQEKIK